MRGFYAVASSLILLAIFSSGRNTGFMVEHIDPPAVRAAKLLKQMTLDEKLTMVHGNATKNKHYVGRVPGNIRLGIPELRMNDGPQGYRDNTYHGTTTQWPSGLTVAASFDRVLMRSWGEAMGSEFRGKGANVQFGPGVNLLRIPVGGRNFEYLSGEDPYLGHELVQPIVRGIQSKGVIANVKHFINNNQENDRHTVSENIDERTQMELYFPAFAGAIQAGVLSMMCGNNKVNEVYTCENNQTVNTILKSWLGFKGWMLSDYRGTQSTIDAANGGLDMQMPGCVRPNPQNPLLCDSDKQRPNYFGEPLKEAIINGSVSKSTIDDKVLRILTSMFSAGLFDHPSNGTFDANVTSASHTALAHELAVYSSVLLQNKGNILPLDANNGKRFAVLGAPAQDAPITGGGGSGAVVPAYISTVLQGIRDLVEKNTSGNCSIEKNVDYFQVGAPKANNIPSPSACCTECWLREDCYSFTWSDKNSGTCWFKSNATGRVAKSGVVSGNCSSKPTAQVVYDDGKNLTHAAAVAASADVAIIVVATTSKEGVDRKNLLMPGVDLIEAVAASQKNTVVVVISPGAFLAKPWASKVAAILYVGMPGQQEGTAVADLLFGQAKECPCGKLPFTIPNKENEVGFTSAMYPGINHQANYSEHLAVGYRWYAINAVQPHFAFGFGLSYTSFRLTNLNVRKNLPFIIITVTIENVGKLVGKEVVQVYLQFPPTANEPPLQLKGFETVSLPVGSQKMVTFKLNSRDLSIWDVETHTWVQEEGQFVVMVGTSSDNTPLNATFVL